MTLLHTISIATTLALALPAQAQTTTARPAAPRPAASAPAADHLSMMDAQMKAMREMHDKMMRARTPEERNALMAEQMKLMQDGMAMMQSMMQMMMDRMPAAPSK